MSQLLSSVIISAVGLTCKAFLNSGLCSITVSNLPVLLDALREERRHSGQGIVTVSNHLSTLDDPVTWGILPFGNFSNPQSLFSSFFRNGQVIETFRGNGIWQPALDIAIEKLNQGHWLHMFGEGKVHQPAMYPQADGIAHLPRFKWGVGRIVMETNIPPLIIPVWLTGFDKLMPEHRPFPNKYFPKLGVKLGVAFGDPIPPEKIVIALSALYGLKQSPSQHIQPPSKSGFNGASHSGGWLEEAIAKASRDFSVRDTGGRLALIDEIRSETTAIIQRAVEDLGRKVSGNKLDLPLDVKVRERCIR